MGVLGPSIRFDGSVSAVVPEARCGLTPCQKSGGGSWLPSMRSPFSPGRGVDFKNV